MALKYVDERVFFFYKNLIIVLISSLLWDGYWFFDFLKRFKCIFCDFAGIVLFFLVSLVKIIWYKAECFSNKKDWLIFHFFIHWRKDIIFILFEYLSPKGSIHFLEVYNIQIRFIEQIVNTHLYLRCLVDLLKVIIYECNIPLDKLIFLLSISS